MVASLSRFICIYHVKALTCIYFIQWKFSFENKSNLLHSVKTLSSLCLLLHSLDVFSALLCSSPPMLLPAVCSAAPLLSLRCLPAAVSLVVGVVPRWYVLAAARGPPPIHCHCRVWSKRAFGFLFALRDLNYTEIFHLDFVAISNDDS